MFKRSHPARRARTAAGIAGATTYLGLVWVIASESQTEASINLDAALGSPGQPIAENQSTLQLNGGATPLTGATIDPAAVNAQLAPAQTGDSITDATDPAAPSTTVTSPPSVTGATSTAAPTTAAPTTAAPTTAAPTTAAPTTAGQTTAAPTTGGQTTAAPTTAAPTTAAPTTAAPTTTAPPTTPAPTTTQPTTTTSSGS